MTLPSSDRLKGAGSGFQNDPELFLFIHWLTLNSLLCRLWSKYQLNSASVVFGRDEKWPTTPRYQLILGPCGWHRITQHTQKHQYKSKNMRIITQFSLSRGRALCGSAKGSSSSAALFQASPSAHKSPFTVFMLHNVTASDQHSQCKDSNQIHWR